jgi:hypothetical protein
MIQMTGNTSIDLGGGGNSFSFESPGDSVTGKVISLEEVQQTDMQTGQPAFWDNGQPKNMFRVELQTELQNDEDDDGKRSVYLKGSRKPESKSSLAAVLAAVRASTGSTAITAGGSLTLTYTGDGQASKRGFNPPKQYSAEYEAAKADLSKKGAKEPAEAF